MVDALDYRDVSVAFFHATMVEEMLVRPPKNMKKNKKIIWKLKKAMYGTQVANSRWQRLVRETLTMTMTHSLKMDGPAGMSDGVMTHRKIIGNLVGC